MSKRPPNPSKPASKAPAASKTRASDASAAGKPKPATKAGSAGPAKATSATKTTSTTKAASATKTTSASAAKPADAEKATRAEGTGVSARAVQASARAAAAQQRAPAPAKGRVRAAVDAVIEIAGKLGEEVLERVVGSEPVPVSAYLGPAPTRAPVAEVTEPEAYLAAVPEDSAPETPVPEDSSADEAVWVESVAEPVAASDGDATRPVPGDSDAAIVPELVDARQGRAAGLAGQEPAIMIDDYIDPEALAQGAAPVPAAYLAPGPHVPHPAVYLADLPNAPASTPSSSVTQSSSSTSTSGPGLGALDRHLFGQGTHLRLYEKLGAQVQAVGVHFAVWAPNARHVSVIGEWNAWDPFRDPLVRDPDTGVWQGLVTAAASGMLYKYRVIGVRGEIMDRADPCAQGSELPPQTASRIVAPVHHWRDAAWLAARTRRQGPTAPISVYELHLGSWLRDEAGDFLSYADIAPRLVAHVQALGFTHVELMPITEHPFYGSWGYQTSAYFAPTARHGGPEGLMQLIDLLHQADIGVILDWVPGHFPADAHGLARFDGTALYEHQDPRRGVHPDWNTLIFNFGRHEVRAFLLSSAMMWIDRYHIDAIRVDAVASMLYLDYSRDHGQWLPNHRGGRENLEAVEFLRALNTAIHAVHPGVITIAEESTSWPLVTGSIAVGGLGFDYKWDMGWMHDSLRYLGRDPIDRSHHHNELTFRMWYAYNERYMLPLSHDEVVHGKYSLLRKMHGDPRARFASLRLLLAYMFTNPGRKLLFMGGEFGQLREWNHDRQLDWALREQPQHAGLERWVARMAHLYREVPALYEQDDDPAGYEWLVVDDNMRSLAVYLRLPARGPVIMVVLNFTPVTWSEHRIGVPAEGTWTLLDRSDAPTYSGEDVEAVVLPERFTAEPEPAHDRPFSLQVTLPPLTALLLSGPEAGALRAAAEAHRAARLAREAEAIREAEAEAARVAEVARAAEAAREAAAATAAEAAGLAAEKPEREAEAQRSATDAARRNDPPGSTGER